MSKSRWKKILWILLSICVFAAVAYLPQIMAAIQDEIIHHSALQSEMQTIELDFEEEDTLQESFLRKINLFRSRSLNQIQNAEMVKTMEEVENVLEKELTFYYEAGLIETDWQKAEKTFTPYLSYSKESGYAIFWEIAFYEKENKSFLNAYLEDETGKIFFINYGTSTLSLTKDEAEVRFEKLVEIYERTLELLSDAEGWKRENSLISDSPMQRYLVYTHETYGEIRIEFYVDSDGFYISLR